MTKEAYGVPVPRGEEKENQGVTASSGGRSAAPSGLSPFGSQAKPAATNAEKRKIARAYRDWVSGPHDYIPDDEDWKLALQAFEGGWCARSKLITRLIADADEEKARADVQSSPLSFMEAATIGESLYERWLSQSDGPPPMGREDAGWADLARVAFEKWRGLRAASVDRNPEGEKPQALSAKHESAVAAKTARRPNNTTIQG